MTAPFVQAKLPTTSTKTWSARVVADFFGRRLRLLAGCHVAVGIAPRKAHIWQAGEPFERARRSVAQRGQIAQHPVHVDAPLRLNVGQHRVERNRVAVDVGQKSYAHTRIRTTGSLWAPASRTELSTLSRTALLCCVRFGVFQMRAPGHWRYTCTSATVVGSSTCCAIKGPLPGPATRNIQRAPTHRCNESR